MTTPDTALESVLPTAAQSARVLLLDTDVPPNPAVSGLTGLSEMSAVDRAVGIMIERGHHPDVAYDALSEQAAAAGVETHVYAAQVLGS